MTKSSARALVLGGYGFLGTNVSAALPNEWTVWRGSRTADGRSQSVVVDLLDASSIDRAIREIQPDVVINCSHLQDYSSERVVTATRNLVNALEQLQHPGRLLHVGSAAEYGSLSREPYKEDDECRPVSAYGHGKLQESTLLRQMLSDSAHEIVIARVFNPVGRGMPQAMLLPALIEQLRQCRGQDHCLLKVSKLTAVRDFLHVRDCGTAIAALAQHPLTDELYNISTGDGMTVETLAIRTAMEFGFDEPEIAVVETGQHTDEIDICVGDNSLLKASTGWAPVNSLADAIQEAVHPDDGIT